MANTDKMSEEKVNRAEENTGNEV